MNDIKFELQTAKNGFVICVYEWNDEKQCWDAGDTMVSHEIDIALTIIKETVELWSTKH